MRNWDRCPKGCQRMHRCDTKQLKGQYEEKQSIRYTIGKIVVLHCLRQWVESDSDKRGLGRARSKSRKVRVSHKSPLPPKCSTVHTCWPIQKMKGNPGGRTCEGKKEAEDEVGNEKL